MTRPPYLLNRAIRDALSGREERARSGFVRAAAAAVRVSSPYEQALAELYGGQLESGCARAELLDRAAGRFAGIGCELRAERIRKWRQTPQGGPVRFVTLWSHSG